MKFNVNFLMSCNPLQSFPSIEPICFVNFKNFLLGACCLLNVEHVIVQIWQNIFSTSIHWGRHTVSWLRLAFVGCLLTDESPEVWEVWEVREVCESSLLFDAGSKCCHYVVSPEGRRSSELTLSLSYNLARSFIHLCAAISSRDQYDLSQSNPLTSTQRGSSPGQTLPALVRWEVAEVPPGLYFVRWSPAQPWRVFTSLVTVTTDKQRKAWASR